MHLLFNVVRFVYGGDGLATRWANAVGILKWLKSRLTPAPNELDVRLAIDDSGVTCERPNGVVESVAWDDLQKVTIMTTDDGPFAEDVFIVLYGSDGGCVVPHGASQSGVLLERLQQLSGFDNESFIQAMSCASNNEFQCWNRTSRPNPVDQLEHFGITGKLSIDSAKPTIGQ